MKKIFKALSTAALTATMLVGSVGCNFVNTFLGDYLGGNEHEHELVKQDAVEATCTQDGTKEYYLCKDENCGQMFSDLNGENQIYGPEIMEKKPHTPIKTVAKEATCLVEGYKEYYTCSSCHKMFSDAEAKNEIAAPEGTGFAAHALVKVEAKAATETTAGNKAYWTCSTCKKLFSDAEGKNETTLSEVYIAPTAALNWKAMAGVSDYVAPTYSNGATTFNAINNSAYIENIFVDENGNSLVGAYNEANANTEYTYSMNIKASGTFHLILFANETTIPVFASKDLAGNPKYGFYIRFDATDAETNVKIQASLGNTSPEQGIKAKGGSSFAFDGETENNVRLVLERYSEDKAILHIWVNGEEITFNKTSTGGQDKIGFQLRTEWNRNDLVNGIGESYTAKDAAYPTISCSRGLSATEGFGSGLGLAVTGNVVDNAVSGTGQASVVLSNISATKTGAQVTHEHTLTKTEEVPATCTTDGTEAYYSCECGKLFSDEEGKNKISAPVVIPASHELTYTAQVDPTETEAGCKEYWACSVCTKFFADENGTIETNLDALYMAPVSHEHTLVHTAATAATALKDGNVEYWQCSGCEVYYADADATQAITLSDTVTSAWKSLKDVSEGAAVVTNGTTAIFNGVNSSSYVDNVFTAGLAGAYDVSVANTEYTYTLKVKTTGTFSIVLFANELTMTDYKAEAINGNVADRMGFYILFDSADADTNVKLKAAVGNGISGKAASTGAKAKTNSTFKFDGSENTVTVRMERYSADKLILHINVNGEELSFKLTSSKGADVCGFNLRTAWDRTNLIDGIGDSYTKTTNAYPTIAISRGLSETEGLGNGMAIATTSEDAVVTLTQLSIEKTGTQVVHVHAPTLVESKAATCTEAGYEAYYECTCGKLYSDAAGTTEIEAPVTTPAKHTLTLVEGKDSTCTEAGYEAYYKCDGCEKLYADAEAVNEIQAPVATALAKHTLTKTEKVEATEDTAGNEEYWTCSVCSKLFTDEACTIETNLEAVKIPALGHTHKMTYVAEKAATCTENGNVAYYACNGCGKNYQEESGETELENVAIEATHTLTYNAPVAATVFSNGNIEYWYCSVCEKYFKESQAETVLTAEELVDPAWTWNSLKDVTNGAPVVADGKGTFTGVNSGSYVANVFEDGLAGAYDANVANTEYTLTVKFKTTGKFILTLFANENTTSDYTSSNIASGVADKLGFMIVFEPTTADDNNNVKLKAAVGNGTSKNKATTGAKAKAFASSLSFDGVTENVVTITVERYSADKLMLEISVNDEKLSFTKTSTKGSDVCGFNLRTVWDRENIGEGYTSNEAAYPTIGLIRGMSTEAGLGDGVAVAAADGVTVVLSEISVAKTGEKVTITA